MSSRLEEGKKTSPIFRWARKKHQTFRETKRFIYVEEREQNPKGVYFKNPLVIPGKVGSEGKREKWTIQLAQEGQN